MNDLPKQSTYVFCLPQVVFIVGSNVQRCTAPQPAAIGSQLLMVGRYEEAVATLKDELENIKAQHGKFNKYVASHSNSLANALYYLQRYEEAATLYENALSIVEQVEQDYLCTALTNLANCRFAQEKFSQAKSLYQSALDKDENMHQLRSLIALCDSKGFVSEKHGKEESVPSTTSSSNQRQTAEILSQIRFELDRHRVHQAKKLFESPLCSAMKTDQPSSQVGEYWQLLGELELQNSKFAIAQAHFLKARTILEAQSPENSTVMTGALIGLVIAYCGQNKFLKAIETANQVFESIDRQQDNRACFRWLEQVRIQRQYGGKWTRSGDIDIVDLQSKLLECIKRLNTPDYLLQFYALMNLERILDARVSGDRMKEILEEAFSIVDRLPDKEDETTAFLFKEFGAELSALGMPVQAATIFDRLLASESVEINPGERLSLLRGLFQNLLGTDPTKAEAVGKRALQIAEQDGNINPRTAISWTTDLANLKEQNGLFEEELAFRMDTGERLRRLPNDAFDEQRKNFEQIAIGNLRLHNPLAAAEAYKIASDIDRVRYQSVPNAHERMAIQQAVQLYMAGSLAEAECVLGALADERRQAITARDIDTGCYIEEPSWTQIASGLVSCYLDSGHRYDDAESISRGLVDDQHNRWKVRNTFDLALALDAQNKQNQSEEIHGKVLTLLNQEVEFFKQVTYEFSSNIPRSLTFLNLDDEMNLYKQSAFKKDRSALETVRLMRSFSRLHISEHRMGSAPPLMVSRRVVVRLLKEFETETQEIYEAVRLLSEALVGSRLCDEAIGWYKWLFTHYTPATEYDILDRARDLARLSECYMLINLRRLAKHTIEHAIQNYASLNQDLASKSSAERAYLERQLVGLEKIL